MKAWKVSVEIEPWPEGGFIARAPALQGCWVVADTVEEVVRDIQEGAEMCITYMLEHSEPLPAEVQELNGENGALHLDVAVAVA